MCGLLFHQIRARCPREPSRAGTSAASPIGCACPGAAQCEHTHARGSVCFLPQGRSLSLSPVTDAGLRISLSVSSLKICIIPDT